MDVHMARQLEEEMERDAQRMNEQIARDAKMARIHAEKELQMMIDGLDRNNETIAKYLQEYYQFARDLPIGEMIELIKSETPKKKKLQEQINVQMARQLEEEMARDAQRMNEQITRDAEIGRIHAEEELKILIDGLDRNNETVAKYLQDYEHFAEEFLKTRIKLLEDKDGGGDEPSGEDAAIKGRSLETGEESASILTSGVQVSVPPAAEVATVSIPPAGEIPTVSVPTSSGVVPTASPIFTTATVATPYSRRKGKEKMVESETPKKKKLQEQMNVQMARQLEEEMARDAQRMNEQITRDAEIGRIHAEEELQILIDGLDRNNETVAKYLQDYEQFAEELSICERIKLINDLMKYQDNYAKVLKYQSQQRKPLSMKQQKEFYMSVLRSHTGWKTKHFKGMPLEEIREKLEQDSAKKAKTSEEVSEEELKEMMQLVPVEEVYVEALQVKHPLINWEIHTEGQRSYWKIIRLGGSTASYQFFVDMLKHFDMEDLNQLWALVKETLNIRQATSDKEK
nr:hypothetical protein [Tanacetum cinerariifolium]